MTTKTVDSKLNSKSKTLAKHSQTLMHHDCDCYKCSPVDWKFLEAGWCSIGLETKGNVTILSCNFNLFIENTRLTVVFRMYQSETSVNS